MSLEPLTDREKIKATYAKFWRNLARGGRRRQVSVGYPGGSGAEDVVWLEELGIWGLSRPISNRYWTCFGTQVPEEGAMLNITVEINPPFTGINRRCAAVFLRDDRGGVYLAHSGKVGGGRVGIGKDAFRDFYVGNWETVAWPDGMETEMIVLGRIDAGNLARRVALFVREVDRFKESATSGKAKPGRLPREPRFTPEFSGKRKSYALSGDIEGRCDHGLVVNGLRELLARRGLAACNDRHRDLYVTTRSGMMTVLFEVKTDVSRNSIYSGVGQLMFHAARQADEPRRVLVLPDDPGADSAGILERLRVGLVTYQLKDGRASFKGLSEALPR